MTSFMFATKWKHNLKSLVATRWKQLQQCRRDGLEFYLDDCYDRLNTCRDGYFLMKQKNHSVATILRQWGGGGGGANIPLWGTMFVFLKRPPGNGPGGPREITTVSRKLQPYGNKHKNRYARRTCIYNRVQKCFGKHLFPHSMSSFPSPH